MKVDRLTREQAEDIANDIYNAKFGVYGQGNFDVSRQDLASILMIAFNENDRSKQLKIFYEMLERKYMY